MSHSQQNSPKEKKKFKVFKHHSNKHHSSHGDVQSQRYNNNTSSSMNYHNAQVHHPQSFASPKPNLSHHTSHHSQSFPQQNNHNHYNNHDRNNSHRHHSSNSPYFTSQHATHHPPSFRQPYSIVDENQPLYHNHTGHHQTRSAMPNLGQSTPNIHHTHTKRYSQDHHNRHGNPPKHNHRGFLGTNGKNTTSNPPNIQLKQSSSTKSNIFNHIPQSPQHHPYNRHYVVNSPPQHPAKSYGNGYNPNHNGASRARSRANTYSHHSSPIYAEEDMSEYPSTFTTDRARRPQPQQNHYHDTHQMNGYKNTNNLMDRSTYKTTMGAISPALPPNNNMAHHNGNFNNFSLNSGHSHAHGRIINTSRSGDHNTAALPSYTNIAAARSCDQAFYGGNNHYANSHNEWPQQQQQQEAHAQQQQPHTHAQQVRHRNRYYSNPEASPAASPVHNSHNQHTHFENNIAPPRKGPRHIKTETQYHIYDNVMDRTPSSDSSCFSMDDDLRNLQEYHLANTAVQRVSSKSSKSRSSRKHKKRKQQKKKARIKNGQKKVKGRQAIWGQPRNKYFVKKSSHKAIVNGSFVYAKSETTKKFLKKRIQQELLFENLPSEMIRKMVKQMYRVDIPARKNVVCCGDPADAYFVIQRGELEVIEKGELKDRLCAGDTFGDNALLYATTHQYTYRARDQCRCWALSQETFDSIRKKQASSRLENSSRLIKFIKSIAMFSALDFCDLQEISDAMMRITYRRGDKIVCEGDSSTHLFIIYRGTCDAYKRADERTVLKSYSAGDCFGELGIMKNQARACTICVTSSSLVAYALPALDFKSLLDYDVVARSMHKKIDQYLAIPEDSKSFENRVECSLDDFVSNSHGCLGVGAFGRVTLVENPHDKSVYALKKVRKNRIVETSQQEHIINEKRIMAALDSPFCIKLFATFKDKLNVYFLLEPVMGGELFSLLRHEKRLKQRTATFYCACVILAFDYLHTKLNVIYRDLKPENLLINTNGYCKLVDFGFAKKRNNTCTLCGTPQYLAPEVIQNFAHGFAVDWWSVGILIYEMIFGYPPFEGDKNMKMYEKILTAPVEFAENPPIRAHTKDIINSLLRKQAHKRLGAGTKGAQSIKKHAFFKRIDWHKMLTQQIDPPWKPRIKGSHDLSAFDRFPDTTPENEKLIEDTTGDLFKWCDEF